MNTQPEQHKARRTDILPPSLPPIGINREQAAALIGISASLFDWAVTEGHMPPPRVLRGRNVWDVAEIAQCFRNIPHKGASESTQLDDAATSGNPWD